MRYWVDDSSFERTEFQRYTQQALIINQLFGVVPYPLEGFPPNSSNRISQYRDYFLRFLQYAGTFALYITHIYCAYHMLRIQSRKEISFFMRILYDIQKITSIINLTLIFCGCHYSRTKFHTFADRLMNLIQGFYLPNGDHILERSVKKHQCNILIGTLLIFICMICDIISRPSIIDSCISMGAFILPTWITLIALTPFSYMVNIMEDVCKSTNITLKNIVRDQDSRASADALYKLEFLQQKMLAINHLLYDSANVYGYLFLNILFSSIAINSVQFWELYQFCHRKQVSIENISFAIYCALWILLSIVQLVLFLNPNHQVIYQIRKIRLTICRITRRELVEMAGNFLDQLLLQETRFLACGIAELDLSILVKISGAVTTNLVLLIQNDTHVE
ncbi:uncharacterized protein LOC129719824 [Wyeomyia smithii]|uniref:uncharacterized protein LOC129719824 n=1 Tax=Wyeomyia smithii TaxID=174621 RepID=UPI002467E095|nr:uncharacterized protein LOC129719824 [Wyeomyia smithii]